MSRQIELVVITPAEISAFVDGELDAEERRDVEGCVRDDERAACLVSAWHWQLGLLHAAFARVIEEPTPQRLRLGGAGCSGRIPANELRNGRGCRALSA